MKHEPTPSSDNRYCTVCGKDLSAEADVRSGQRRHYTTKKATIAKRLGAAN